jgi:hypothetical protein
MGPAKLAMVKMAASGSIGSDTGGIGSICMLGSM